WRSNHGLLVHCFHACPSSLATSFLGNIPPTEYVGADFEIYRNVTCKTEHNRTFPKKMTASLSSERGASSCADSCFDSWINFPASTIKRAVFLFSSSTLRRNKADS